MSDINVTIEEKEIISVTITSGSGTNNHAQLSNLDYINSGHQGFEPEIPYDDDYRSFMIEKK